MIKTTLSALTALIIMVSAVIITLPAQAENINCPPEDKSCLFMVLDATTAKISESAWRDQTWREAAKLLALEKRTEEALALIGKIENPDTKAMTIRGIGMEAAKTDLTVSEFTELFTKLRAEAEKISHPPSYAIALTYIAMAQAFAGDNQGAMKTAADMENDALRNKAYAESAEIQAERNDINAALASIAKIDSGAFRNKAYGIISKIFADRQGYTQALSAAEKIDNDYQRAQSILYVLTKQISPVRED